MFSQLIQVGFFCYYHIQNNTASQRKPQNKIFQSFSRSNMPHDNAVTEAFFSIFTASGV